MDSLKGKVAVVTGASRGVGKGIAVGLGESGATVYITGRTVHDGEATVPLAGTLLETVKEIERAGGKGIPIRCDHRNDDEVKAVFDQVLREQGKLDILVNNAWAGYENIARVTKPEEYIFEAPFWEQPISFWDDMQTVGLRSTYVASHLAAPIMLKQKDGLIVNISFFAGRKYMSNVAYGVCKAAVDRLTTDSAIELRDYGVTVLSLYPGLVRTESVMRNKDFIDLSNSESPQFLGRCVAALAGDQARHSLTGQIVIAAEIAEKYGFRDIDGKQPKSLREQLW
ncbi:MAG TPA: SDR family NAD(P)-dependent oxidoreductase [Bacillota bacterium]|nr:SDR family NAD(P)-dependent oxidoreductase [Bacillota bacterium]